MGMAVSLGLKLVASILNDGDIKTFSKLEINPVTLKDHEAEAFNMVREFVYNHKAIPKHETVLSEMGLDGLPVATEVPSYYAEQIRQRYISDTIKKGFADAKPHLSKETMNVEQGVIELTNALMDIHRATNKRHVVDFKESSDYIAQAYKQKKIQGMDGTVLMGYPTVDIKSGGMVGGDLVSIVGRPAMGKTFHTLYMGHNAWWEQGKTVLYVPLEMPILAIEQRLASMHTKHNLTQLKKAQLSTVAHKDLLKRLSVLTKYDHSLWIAGGDVASTVEDIWKLCMQMNPDIVIVDGAYLLSHPNPRLGKYERVAENARSLKQDLAMDFNIPCVASWQFNRNASKKLEKDGRVGLEDIGYTDEIGQLSSVVLGLLQEESVETVLKRKVDILKGRDGEIGDFYTNWDFYNMDFSECEPPVEAGEGEEEEHELLVN